MNANKVIYKELSYKLVGVLFNVHKKLGGKYQEKYYQRAVEKALNSEEISFKKELSVDLKFKGEKIGKYFLDFLVEDKVVLELKATPFFHPDDFRQILGYLKAKRLKLGILANFRGRKLTYKRILNSEVDL
ncbi:GxxExxY protein [Candidatus Curtissbacteria bacterium]|nr:GxxExxY protein [Candidatus Curtissbacteria bacterium]